MWTRLEPQIIISSTTTPGHPQDSKKLQVKRQFKHMTLLLKIENITLKKLLSTSFGEILLLHYHCLYRTIDFCERNLKLNKDLLGMNLITLDKTRGSQFLEYYITSIFLGELCGCYQRLALLSELLIVPRNVFSNVPKKALLSSNDGLFLAC